MGRPAKLFRVVFWLCFAGLTMLAISPAPYLPPLGIFSWWDKAQHALAFFCLGMTGLAGYASKRWHLAGGLVLYGGGLEFVQSTTGWRHGDLNDWFANVVGIAASLACMSWFCAMRRQFQPKAPPAR